MDVVTTNIRLDQESYRHLKLLAVEKRKSLAQLIREAVQQVYGTRRHSKRVANWRNDPFLGVIGICATGIRDGSVHHDRDIYGVKA